MSSTSPSSAPHAPNRTLRILAPLLSLFVFPSLGHAIVERPLRGAAWVGSLYLGTLVVILLGRIELRLLVALPIVLLALILATALDAWVVGARGARPTVLGWIAFGSGVLALFVYPVLLALALRATLVEAFRIPSAGMCPTLVVNDHVFVDRTAYLRAEPRVGDVVVHRSPAQPGYDFIRRVVAVGGDELEIRADGVLVLNGTAVLTRPSGGNACDNAATYTEDLGSVHEIAIQAEAVEPGRFTVPPGTLFLVGDNRQSSADSRHHGPVPVASVRGRVARRWRHGGALVWDEVR
ncbi:MAG: signal peptidase I [Polyangiaceae bacterium]|nr:signal peptidase I [Polyangiaceae bacterium]